MSTSFKTQPPSFDPTRHWDGFVDIDSVIPDPDQPRTYFNSEKITTLAESIRKNGQQVAIRVRQIKDPNNPQVAWQIIGGDRRHRASKQIGLTQVKITYSPESRPQSHRAALIDNCCREDMTLGDKARGVKRELDGGASVKELAKDLGWSEGYIYQLNQVNDLEPTLFARLSEPTPREERIPLTIALELCRRDHETQLRVYRKATRGEEPKSKAAILQTVRVELAKIDNTSVIIGTTRTGSGRKKKQGDVVDQIINRLRTMQDAAKLLFQYADMCEPSQVTPSAKKEIGELVASIASNLIRTSNHMGSIVPT